MTSASVRGRFETDPRRYPVQCAFYRLLDASGEVVARFAPRGSIEGPEIVVYRMGSRFHAATESLGDLDSLWWTRRIPNGYRALATRMLVPGESTAPRIASPAPEAPGLEFARNDALPDTQVSRLLAPRSRDAAGGAVLADSLASAASADDMGRSPGGARAIEAVSADGTLPAWVRSLVPVYDARIRQFSDRMAMTLARSGRYDAAARFARGTLAIHPEDDATCMVFSVCAREVGWNTDARAAIERTLEIQRDRPVDPGLRLEYARVLGALGEHDRSRTELATLTAITDPADPVAAEARRMLAVER
jgi:hypothetical protein